MSYDIKRIWDDSDFEEMSWHDNHFYGFTITECENGKGTLTFHLDYILDWIKSEEGHFEFKIAPAKLTFHEVFGFNISLDFASASAATGPFSIDSISRKLDKRARYTAIIWTLPINWPKGSIQFEAASFKQELLSDPVICEQQRLTLQEREECISEGVRQRIRRIEEKALRNLRKKKDKE